LVASVWNSDFAASTIASRVGAKFKLLHRVLRHWGNSLSKLNKVIKECNSVLLIIDRLEEGRTLSIQEANFRRIIKRHTLNLLERKKIFWKQRYTVRWTKLGDECTEFFHAAATERYRNNSITSLESEHGDLITEHHSKATLLWEDFKDRMGQSQNPVMLFDMHNLVSTRNLEELPASFSHEDIDNIIKHLPANKAPGPNGFNGAFFKKCWHIIKGDIYLLCDAFFQNREDL